MTLPIVMPAIFSAFLLTFASSMSAFAVPAFLGTPVRYYVLTTQLYRTLNGVNQGYGYVLAVVMLAVGLFVLAFNQWFVGKRKSFTTVTGKSSQVSLVKLRGARTPISVGVLFMLLLIAILPLVSFAVESFTIRPTLPLSSGWGREARISPTASRESCATSTFIWACGTASSCPCAAPL